MAILEREGKISNIKLSRLLNITNRKIHNNTIKNIDIIQYNNKLEVDENVEFFGISSHLYKKAVYHYDFEQLKRFFACLTLKTQEFGNLGKLKILIVNPNIKNIDDLFYELQLMK